MAGNDLSKASIVGSLCSDSQRCHSFQDGPQLSSRQVQQKPQACCLLDLKLREIFKFLDGLAGNRHYYHLDEKWSPSP